MYALGLVKPTFVSGAPPCSVDNWNYIFKIATAADAADNFARNSGRHGVTASWKTLAVQLNVFVWTMVWVLRTMDTWKAEVGRVREEKRREEKKRREEERRSKMRKSQKREDPGARKGIYPMIWGSAKAAGAEPAGQMRDEKLHAVVARGAKHISKSKCTRHTRFGPLLKVEMSNKCTPLWREAHFEVKILNATCSDHFLTFKCRFAWQAQGILCTLSEVSKTWGFCSISKNDGRRGTFEEDLQRCIFRGRRSTRDMFIRDVRGSGRWFPERGCILEHQIFRFAEMILRDRSSTLYDLGITFSWQAQYFRRVEWKNRKTHWYEAVSSALNFPFLKEVSQNCFVFDVVKCKNWGSLSE